MMIPVHHRPAPADGPDATVAPRSSPGPRLAFASALLLGALAFACLLPAGCLPRATRFDPYAPSSNPNDLTNLTSVSFTNGITPRMLQPSVAPFRLGPGDRIDIELIGEPEGPQAVSVGPDGRIYFHLLPGFPVWGLTLAEAKVALEQAVAQFVARPVIGITLREVQSQRVWVLGRINTPGIYPLDTPVTVLESITKAGGLFTSRFSGTTEELADLHHSFVIRGGRYLPVDLHKLIREGDTSQNIYLEPDDFVYLPSSLASEVYVLGAVSQPRAVGFKDQVTLISAIANARGTVPGARRSQVAIVRGALSTPSIGVVDLDDIVRGRSPDVRLQPRDIVYVPFSPYNTLSQYGTLIVNTFVRTVASNEGGRAVDGNYKTPGVSIPIGQ